MSEDREFEHERVKELVQDKCDALEITDERERYAATSSMARQIHAFVNASDLQFSPSDLDSKEASGEWRYQRKRRETKARRQQMVSAAGL